MPDRPPPTRRHCRRCDVEWDGETRNCWVCGQYGTRGWHPEVNWQNRHTLYHLDNTDDGPLT